MNVTVMRQVKFCAGHRLLGHEGKCANLHGHNYLVEFHISGKEIDELGRVVDFSVLKKLFQGWIDEHWDHGFLLWDKDDNAVAAIKSVEPNRLYLLPYNPTAENMARYLLEDIAPKLIASIQGYALEVRKVVVWETENAFAEVSQESGDSSANAMLGRSQESTFR